MTIEQHLRSYSNRFIRPLYVKEQCEVCGITESLHLHHISPFVELLSDCFNSLEIEYREYKDDYTDTELENIINWMLGKELRSHFLTLCFDCHIDEHDKDGGFAKIGDGFQQWVRVEREKKELRKKKKIKHILPPYLDSIVGKKLYSGSKCREDFIKKVGVKDSYGRLQKSARQLNEYFVSNNLQYILISRRDRRSVLGDGSKNKMRDKSFWELVNKGMVDNNPSKINNSITTKEE